jgi:hypothetical protein
LLADTLFERPDHLILLLLFGEARHKNNLACGARDPRHGLGAAFNVASSTMPTWNGVYGGLIAKAGLKVRGLLRRRRDDAVPLVEVVERVGIVKVEPSGLRMRWIIDVITV